nr:farnesyl pyrophosphate synthase-like isoform X1 [Leptinotarsa decemlineata]
MNKVWEPWNLGLLEMKCIRICVRQLYLRMVMLLKSLQSTIKSDFFFRASSKLIQRNPFLNESADEFTRYFPEFVEVLVNEELYGSVPKLKEQLREVVQSNIGYGNNVRGKATVAAYKAFEKQENLSTENIKLAVILGLCFRTAESSILIVDDILDNASTRYGRPCWFKNKKVGLRAIIDGIYLENGTHYILRKYFWAHPQYLNLVELFLEMYFITALGQSMDLMNMDMDDFTIDNYNKLTVGKAEYCLFTIPIVAAMFLANNSDQETHRQVRSVLSSLGNFYQIQNDFQDCYGNPENTGKIGSDIREGKFSWLVVKAFQKANSSQRMIIQENYGKNDDKSIETIRNLYNDLQLEEEYKNCENQAQSNISSKISSLSEHLPRDLFYILSDNLFHGNWGT